MCWFALKLPVITAPRWTRDPVVVVVVVVVDGATLGQVEALEVG